MLIPLPEADPVFNERTAAIAAYIAGHLSIDLRLTVNAETFLAKLAVFMPDATAGEIRGALKSIGDERRRLFPRRRNRHLRKIAPARA